MLKIALPTFKNDENHTKNSVCDVRCGENSVLKWRNVCGVRRFLCVFQAFAMFICGKNVVRKQQNCGVFAAYTCFVSCISVAKVAKWWCDGSGWWCVSGVSNPDFRNFTKHSTVLTSILQQINTLYQHFPYAETAKPALEQAKTMLKIALPTFKNNENHTQNSKIHTQNSVCEVRCGENYVQKRQNVCCGGGFMIDCGMFCRGCGGFNVFFRRLQGLFAAKMWCGNGEMVVRCSVLMLVYCIFVSKSVENVCG